MYSITIVAEINGIDYDTLNLSQISFSQIYLKYDASVLVRGARIGAPKPRGKLEVFPPGKVEI